ncbi:MAG: hypothetical protein ABMA00_14735, partial [Gemmatimonas sp.]
AKGVSPGSEKALLAINPALSSYFTGDPDTATGDEALRRRTLALNELLSAVSDEQPLALALDDLQWADNASCAVLAGAMAAMEDAPCLLITASREAASPALATTLSTTIPLAPLDCDGVMELVQSLGALPDEPWAQTLPALLHRTTSGIPLHVLDALVLSMERGVLARTEQSWQSTAPAKLQQLLEQGATLPRRIEGLSVEERTVLLVLAVAGEPCTRDWIQRAVARSSIDLDHVFALLERAGYVTISEERCAIAHDTLTDAILALATEDDTRRVHAELALVVLDTSLQQGDALARYTLRAAIAHALRSGQDDTVRMTFRAYVSRSRSDARPLTRIASDALGDADSPGDRARLLASLPKRQRVLHRIADSWMLLASAAALTVVAGLSGAWIATRAPTPVPDGELVLMRADTTGRSTLFSLPLSSVKWEFGSPIDVQSATPILTLPTDPMLMSAVPTGRTRGEWVGAMMQADSGVTDLFLFAPGASPRRLTSAPGDDITPNVSPDGQQVVFSTARWNRLGSRSLAILDLRSGVVSRLTNDIGSDDSPNWSPDGGRVAFARTTVEGFRLCTIHVDGRSTACPDSSQSTSGIRPLAWRNDSILLVERSGQLARVHVDSATLSILDTARATRRISMDGRWTVAQRLSGSDLGRCDVSLTETVASARPLNIPSNWSASCDIVAWSAPSLEQRRFIASLQIDRSGSDPVVGAPHAFVVTAIDGRGEPAFVRHVDWSSSDTAVAFMDQDGWLRPRKAGVVTIRASSGGWRTDERRVEIRAPNTTVLMRESWNDKITLRWRPFGDPDPRIVDAGDGDSAFFNNGDGVFQSGAHSVRAFPIRDGLALDTWLVTPITMDRWQVVRIGLYGGVDSLGLARWNHRDGWAFAPGRQHNYSCEFQFPAGSEGMRTFAERYLAARQALIAPSTWRSGTRFRVRLQIFPDGRCGVGLDGRAVAIGDAGTRPATGTAHVYLYGNSPNTQMLVGPVMVTEGVPDGVDWFSVDSAAANPHASGVAGSAVQQRKRLR